MAENLADRELVELVRTVFAPRAEDRRLAMLTDLPAAPEEDSESWRERRALAADWAHRLGTASADLDLEVTLVLVRRSGAHNAELPETGWVWEGPLPADTAAADKRSCEPLEAILSHHDLVIAPTRFSATAPLKLAAGRLGLRAATMPGFTTAMIPALRIDWAEVDRRVRHLTALLDRSDSAELLFATPLGEHRLRLDLRHRTAHVSGGLVREPGTAGNLPSGESYIVPYEGEVLGDPSLSAGILPVQWGDEVVLYRIEANRAVEILSRGPEARREADRLTAEPAYGNLAELGLGVLSPFGLEPIGEVLLDEKLGLHIAFGRSDHFGGQVGPGDFRSPEAVVHHDHVYLPALQPAISVRSADLVAGNETIPLIRHDDYVVSFPETTQV